MIQYKINVRSKDDGRDDQLNPAHGTERLNVKFHYRIQFHSCRGVSGKHSETDL